MALGHEMDIRELAGDGELAVVCTCSWFTTITDAKFAEPIYSRHLRVNLIPPHNKPEEWE